jgi:mono/diheme cytochrome c family protein
VVRDRGGVDGGARRRWKWPNAAVVIGAAAALVVATPMGTCAQARSAIERGKYVFGATGGCGCHTEPGQPLNAGGRRYDGPFGTVFSPNITPDATTGIGQWTDEQIGLAIRSGRRPDGTRLIPVHPFPSFNGMADDDLRSLVAFLKTVRPTGRSNTPKKIVVPLFETAFLPAWLVAFAPREASVKVAPTSGLARGEYLVKSLGHCGECHTPRRVTLAVDNTRLLAGNKKGQGPEGKEVPNITPDRETGIGAWSDLQIAEYLRSGKRPDGDSASGLMEEMIKGTSVGLRNLSTADRLAIAAYLKSLPAIKSE